MSAEAILYQSVLQHGQMYQQLSNLVLDGLSTNDATLNTDNGRLYGSFTKSGPMYTFSLYKDVIKTELVVEGTATAVGSMTLTEQNDSGLSGTVNFAQYAADDTSIEAVCFVSKDSDIPMNNLEGLSDYDQVNGFAEFHLEAFQYLKDFVRGRHKSQIFNPTLIDSHQINSGLGGYDFSRVINWPSLKDASAHYAFVKIAEKQYVAPGGVWDVRVKESRNIIKAHLSSVELLFDTNLDRVVDKARSFSVWKTARA